MNTKKVMLKIVSMCLISAMLFSGYKKKEEKKKRDTTDIRHAESLLDDFCAYLKSGKFDKLSKLIDGESDWIEDLTEMKSSVGSSVLDKCLKRIDYEFEDTSASEDDEEGESTVVITYFETKDVTKKTESDSSKTEIEDLIDDAEEIEIEFSVDLVFDDDWLIKSKSVDSICKELFGFLTDYDIMNTQGEPSQNPTGNLPPFEECYSWWYDDSYNTLNGIYESCDYVNYYVVTYEYYSNVTVTYEFVDDNGQIVYEGDYTLGYSDDVICCEGYFSSKLPAGELTCNVYDPNGQLFSVGSIEVFEDGSYIYVDVYMSDFNMIDDNNMPVPGFTTEDTSMRSSFYVYANTDQPLTLVYKIYHSNNGSFYDDEFIFDGEIEVDYPACSDEIVFEWNDEPMEAGEYAILFEDIGGNTISIYIFQVIEPDEEFENDEDSAEVYYSCFYKNRSSCYEVTSINQGTDSVVYQLITEDYYECMGFTFELVDESGKTLAEGKFYIMNYDDEVMIDITGLKDCKPGDLTLTVYNPDGSVLDESVLKVK